MARPRATEEQRQAQRQRIRYAARELAETHGVENLSIRGVAALAGVSQGTIYSYFADRSELMRSLWLDPVNEAGRGLETIAAVVADPVERIRALLLAYVDFALARPDVHRGAMLFVRPASQERPETSPPEDLPFYRLLVEAITELADAGAVLSHEPRRCVELLWAAVHGSLSLAINSDIYQITPGSELAPDMVELLMQTVVNPLGEPVGSGDERVGS